MAKPHTPTSLTEEDIARLYANVPQEMQDAEQWCCFKIANILNKNTMERRLTKIPCNAKGVSIDATNASSCLSDLAKPNKLVAGLGFSLRSPFVGWDIDDCLVNGKLTDESIADDLAVINSYTEISPSGTGLHIIFNMEKKPEWVERARNSNYELYFNRRYFTVTGKMYAGSNPEIRTVSEDELRQIYKKIDPNFDTVKETHGKDGSKHLSTPRVSYTPKPYNGKTGGTDAEVISRLYEHSKSEKLFTGEWQDARKCNGQPYGSQSEADLALMHCIAVQTNYDWYQSDSIFRKSALMREKWDDSRDEVTYGERTMLQEFKSSSHQENIPEEVRRRAP